MPLAWCRHPEDVKKHTTWCSIFGMPIRVFPCQEGWHRPVLSFFAKVSLVFSRKLPKVACSQKFAFAQRSGAMKAPVGLLSDRTVLRSKMEGSHPDKFAFAQRSCVPSTNPAGQSWSHRPHTSGTSAPHTEPTTGRAGNAGSHRLCSRTESCRHYKYP